MIEQANKALPDAKSSLEDATREISCANIDIKELTETNREYLEKYSGAKQKVHDITTKIEEQNKISQVIQNKDYFSFIELYKEYSIKAIQYGKYYEELAA